MGFEQDFAVEAKAAELISVCANCERYMTVDSIASGKRQPSEVVYSTKNKTVLLQDHTEEKHNVFMWCIDKYLPAAEAFMARLGYKLHARIIWDKLNGPAPAFTVRFQTEYLLWFYKPGKIVMPRKERRGKYSTIIREGSTIHSKKPRAAYEMLEDMFPDASKIELFARNTRDGWDGFGDELEVSNGTNTR